MRSNARTIGFCLNVAMRKTATGLVIALLLAAPASAYGGRWLVVENSDTQTCYRLIQMPDGGNWVRLGIFNTFREAGMWTWEHRTSLCRHSPVFG